MLKTLPVNLSAMGDLVTSIVRKCTQSLLQLDSDLAREVTQDDLAIDQMKINIKSNITDAISNDPGQTEPLIALLMASNRLERIADHATNIAEDVIYMVEAEIVRHQDVDKHSIPRYILSIDYSLILFEKPSR